eukprot:9396290-Lingulodinium_polyedra.AAC.1
MHRLRPQRPKHSRCRSARRPPTKRSLAQQQRPSRPGRLRQLRAFLRGGLASGAPGCCMPRLRQGP